MTDYYGVPRLEVVPGDWEAHLKAAKIESWYHNPRTYAALRKWHLEFLAKLLAPRGYSTFDNDGRPDDGDKVTVKESAYKSAREALRAVNANLKPSYKEMDALLLVVHEYCHTHVRGGAPENGIDARIWEAHRLQEEETYGHPNGWAAVRHASRTGYGINAFTGLLRFRRNVPPEIYQKALRWFQGQVAIREA